ncbi:MAG: leucine-rich repeat domain-containing protein [Clostridia bacterium]|nr:leucine-rich repeat domain-containing protein [Clostridia bacterium]
MRKIRVLSAVLAAVLMTCLLASCTANIGDPDAINDYVPEVMTVTTDNGVFTFANGEGDTAILVKYSGKATTDDHVVIPEKFNDRKVVAIGDSAFYHLASIVEVKIPETVESIGAFAFAECTELPSITLPDAVETIGKCAFEGCTKLTEVKFPASLQTIGDFAFANCTALPSVTLPASLTTIGKAAFEYDTALTAIEIPASVTTIGPLCFYDCTGIESIKLTDNITEIGPFCFVTEKSTLKDKIDLTGLDPEGYVAKYVAAIAEPTPETEVVTEAVEPAA